MKNPYAIGTGPQRTDVSGLYGNVPVGTALNANTGEPFNLPAFGGVGRSGTPKLGEKQMAFTDGGHLNAYSNTEALQTIQWALDQARIASTDQPGGTPVIYGDPNKPMLNPGGANMYTTAEQHNILAQAMSDPSNEGFMVMGQELLGPVRQVIDYEGISRKILGPRDVKQGEIVRYDLDVYVVAVVIGDDGETPECMQGGAYIYPAFYEITAKPSVKLRDIYEMQYDVLARVQDRARQSIEYQEDRALRNSLNTASTVTNTPVAFASLNLAALEALRYQVEQHRLVADKILINRQELSDIVTQVSQQVDPITQRELIMAGFVGSILNMLVITSAGTNTFEAIPAGECYAVTNSSYLGGMPIRVPLMSQPADLFIEGKPVRGWYWYELLATTVFNSDAVALGQRL